MNPQELLPTKFYCRKKQYTNKTSLPALKWFNDFVYVTSGRANWRILCEKHSDAPLLLLISNKTFSCKTFQKGMNSPPLRKKRCINIIELKVPFYQNYNYNNYNYMWWVIRPCVNKSVMKLRYITVREKFLHVNVCSSVFWKRGSFRFDFQAWNKQNKVNELTTFS